MAKSIYPYEASRVLGLTQDYEGDKADALLKQHGVKRKRAAAGMRHRYDAEEVEALAVNLGLTEDQRRIQRAREEGLLP